MSQRRREAFQFNKEWLETSAIEAAKRRPDEPVVILLLDLDDAAGFQIASTLAGEDEARKRRDACAANKSSAMLTVDTTVDAVDLMFPDSSGWAGLKSSQLPSGAFRVVIIGDGGVSFAAHQLPA